MYILEVEGRVLDRLSQLVDPADAEAMRRYAPIRRDRFDNFIYQATRWAMDDGAPDSFSYACSSLQAAYRSNPGAIGGPVPLVPPAVAEQVGSIASRWRRGERVPGEWALPADEAQLRDELFLSLGGDLGDGLAAAGRRLCSRMWSARIADGFVHPAIGGHIWNGNLSSDRSDLADAGDPLIAGLAAVGDMTARWQAEPENRSLLDREIADLAQTLGWKP